MMVVDPLLGTGSGKSLSESSGVLSFVVMPVVRLVVVLLVGMTSLFAVGPLGVRMTMLSMRAATLVMVQMVSVVHLHFHEKPVKGVVVSGVMVSMMNLVVSMSRVVTCMIWMRSVTVVVSVMRIVVQMMPSMTSMVMLVMMVLVMNQVVAMGSVVTSVHRMSFTMFVMMLVAMIVLRVVMMGKL